MIPQHPPPRPFFFELLWSLLSLLIPVRFSPRRRLKWSLRRICLFAKPPPPPIRPLLSEFSNRPSFFFSAVRTSGFPPSPMQYIIAAVSLDFLYLGKEAFWNIEPRFLLVRKASSFGERP